MAYKLDFRPKIYMVHTSLCINIVSTPLGLTVRLLKSKVSFYYTLFRKIWKHSSEKIQPKILSVKCLKSHQADERMTKRPGGGGFLCSKVVGCSSYLLGFAVPIFGISKGLPFCLKFETYSGIF